MSSKNRTSLVANTTLDWILPTITTTEAALWDAGQYTPLKANGNVPRSWRLVASGIDLNGGSDVTINLYNGALGSPARLMAAVTIPAAHLTGGIDWYLTAEIVARLQYNTTNAYWIAAYGFFMASDGTVFPLTSAHIGYDTDNDSVLTVAAVAAGANGSISIGTIALESLN